MFKQPKNILIIFGGRSSEHDISVISAAFVARHTDTSLFRPVLVGVTKQGSWHLANTAGSLSDGSWEQGRKAFLSPDAEDKCLFVPAKDGLPEERIRIDAAFPVLHGLFGEDGTIQGLFELAGIPYVGCGVLSSAISMDKLYTKLAVGKLGVRQAKYLGFSSYEYERDPESAIQTVEKTFSYPVFVKPSNAGSSKGVSKAADTEALKKAMELAFANDRKLLVEEYIPGREIECAVLGGGSHEILATMPGEILSGADFYDFDAKYNSPSSRTVVDPPLPDGCRERVQAAARAIFAAVDGYGLSRVDFFLTKDNDLVFNEINTLPGFTQISMYPMLWQAMGLDGTKLITQLIDMAFDRPTTGGTDL